MRRTTTMTTTFAALGGAALLLAGCSGGSDASAGTDETGGETAAGVYEFQTNGIEPSEEITIRVPGDLREAMGADADDMVVDQVAVTGRDLGNAQACAADLAITYMDGQPDGLVSAGSDAGQRSKAEEALLERSEASSIDEIVTEVDEIIADGKERGLTAQQIGEKIQMFAGVQGTFYTDGATGQEVVDGYLSGGSEGETTNAGIITKALGLTSTKEPSELSDFDESAPEAGTYIADDFSTLTVVGDCAASATDPDNAIEIELPSVDADGKSDTTATVQVSVMTDGTIGVAGEVDGFMRDDNGDWIAS
ncbi:hypothetical protein [Brevibacterium zhoupengii]|uniref:hypothetical protein n=1 Tax=Brevibacterium zhoupengii TaxID=2898795 RepID=UPI001E44B5CB|nr:hypothetical protein [Brevibacterium zhoupengii]